SPDAMPCWRATRDTGALFVSATKASFSSTDQRRRTSATYVFSAPGPDIEAVPVLSSLHMRRQDLSLTTHCLQGVPHRTLTRIGLKRPLGSPVIASAGKTEPPSLLTLSQT